MVAGSWDAPPSHAALAAAGRDARRSVPRRRLAELTTTHRDPLGILAAQNATRVPDLVPLRTERMASSAFAFYRGTAALMAADLARGTDSGIAVASCGDAHVSNFGFYGSPQRTLVFDLNDFDEAAWAPWEWDLKRLVTSIVIAGQATARDDAVVTAAARRAVFSYTRALATFTAQAPVVRYFSHFDATGGLDLPDRAGRRVVKKAIRHARRRTAEQAARKLTAADAQGRLRFVEAPPAMTHLDADTAGRVERAVEAYIESAQSDIRLLLQHYAVSDTVRRAVGVGSVGTRCYVTALQDGDDNVLLLQTKEAGASVLVTHGGCRQPDDVAELTREWGEGARVVALQRILQGVSDPFLGSFRGDSGDFYVRQFRDMKGGIEMESLDDGPFELYARTCATTLARAHSQSPGSTAVSGYLGSGRAAADAVVEWAYAYADLSRADYDLFLATH